MASVEPRELPLFLCYRQIDGSTIARWLHTQLNETTVGENGRPVKVSVYFDQNAPATGDWTAIHKPSLERSRGLILICTPGVFAASSKDDWLHMELNWWIKHRETAPIIIDATGEGERWIPAAVREKWPNSQRILLTEDSLANDATAAERVLQQIIDGIRFSESETLFEDVAEQRRLLHRYKTMLVAKASIGGLALIALILVWQLNQQLTRSNERLDAAVKKAEASANVAAKIAEADLIILEVLHGKAIRDGTSDQEEAQKAWNAVQSALEELRSNSDG